MNGYKRKSSSCPFHDCIAVIFFCLFLSSTGCTTGTIGPPYGTHELSISRYGGPVATVGIVVHTWSTPAGIPQPQYNVTFSSGNLGQGPGALTWITGDVDGNGLTDIIQPWSNVGTLGLIVYSPSGNTYQEATSFNNPNMGEGAGALAWLSGDFNNDGLTDIMQPWDNNGRLGLIVYTSNGTVYQRAWRGTLDEGPGALKWLTGDVDGDGRTDIIQPWNNNGKIAFIVYGSDGSTYQVNWRGTMDEGAGLISLQTGDVNGDGLTDVIQVWDNNGRVAFITYLSNGTGFVKGWRGTVNEGPGAVAWLKGDVDADGTTDIMQLWDNNGKLAIITYTSNGTSYTVAGKDTMPEGPGALAWLTGDINGDNRTDIIQPWNNSGNLSLITYRSTGTGYQWNSKNTSTAGAGNLALLSGDGNGDGLTDVLQMWNNPNGTSVSITNDDADLILRNATTTLKTNNGVTDVSCNSTMKRLGNVKSFNVGDGSVDNEDELDDVHDVNAHVKVVADLNFCGTIGLNILGCGKTPGDSIVVVRTTPFISEGNLWAHEFGHNQSLEHRDEDKALRVVVDDIDATGGDEITYVWNNQSTTAMSTYQWNTPNSNLQLITANEELNEGAGALAWIPVDSNGDNRGDVVQAWNNNGNLALILYTSTGTNFQKIWKGTTTEGPGALAWLTGDVNNDGRTDIIQPWNNNGKLAFIVYSSTGSSYQMTWKGTTNEGPGALTWLTGDVNGDNQTDIIQPWNNNGKLAFIVYTSNGSSYQMSWTNTTSEGAGALALLTGDVNADGLTDIIQLWDNNGRLAFIVYPSSGSGYTLTPWKGTTNEGPGAIKWLTGDFNGDGRTDVIQPWNNGGKVSFIVYTSNGTGYAMNAKSSTNEGPGAVDWSVGDVDGDGDTDIVQTWKNTGSDDYADGMIVYTASDADNDGTQDSYQVAWRTGRLLPGPNAVMNRSLSSTTVKVTTAECHDFRKPN